MLSQFCRRCKGKFAEYVESMQSPHDVERTFLVGIWYLFLLTIQPRTGILTRRTFPSEEVMMSDEKRRRLAPVADPASAP